MSVKNEEPKKVGLGGGREKSESGRGWGRYLKALACQHTTDEQLAAEPLTFATQAHTHTVSESSAFHNPKSEGEEREGGPAAPGVHRTA
jgi:hypothetical protein